MKQRNLCAIRIYCEDAAVQNILQHHDCFFPELEGDHEPRVMDFDEMEDKEHFALPLVIPGVPGASPPGMVNLEKKRRTRTRMGMGVGGFIARPRGRGFGRGSRGGMLGRPVAGGSGQGLPVQISKPGEGVCHGLF